MSSPSPGDDSDAGLSHATASAHHTTSIAHGPKSDLVEVALREQLGWGRISLQTARTTLGAATYPVCLRHSDALAGLLRIMGDGVLYLFVADVMVHPAYAGRGLGNLLMESAVARINRVADPAASVTLIPLAGREGSMSASDSSGARTVHSVMVWPILGTWRASAITLTCPTCATKSAQHRLPLKVGCS